MAINIKQGTSRDAILLLFVDYRLRFIKKVCS